MSESVDDRLIARLAELAERHDALLAEISRPEVASDGVRSVEIGKELGRLKRLVAPYREFERVSRELAEVRSVADDSGEEASFRELAASEISGLERARAELLEKLKEKLVTDEDAAISSLILEIRAGTGGDEAALFARDLYEMYLRYCERKRFKVG